MMFNDINGEIFNMNCVYLDEAKKEKHSKLPLKSAIKKRLQHG